MSKGSRARKSLVPMASVDASWDTIFGKKEKMTPSVESMKTGTCGCGRSPTGNCIGWHNLSESEFTARLDGYNEQQVSAAKVENK